MKLESLQQQLGSQKQAQDQWDPPLCGEIDLVIKYDGSWHYAGSPINRQPLIKLFARVLRKEQQQYLLVTPVEKVIIHVEDAPFIITQWNQLQGQLYFTTSIEDEIQVGSDHPVKLMNNNVTGEKLPYCLIRDNLWARLHQNVFYQLAAIGEIAPLQGSEHLLIKSGDYSFSLGEV